MPTPIDDFPVDATTTGVIIPDGPLTPGNLNDGGDVDWFAITVQAGVRYFAGGPVEVRLVDATGKTLAYGFGFDVDAVLYRPDFNGTVYLEVTNIFGDGPGDPLDYDYNVGARTIPDDYLDGIDTQAMLPVGSFLNGLSEIISDEDWVKVELEAGKTYQIDAFGNTEITGKRIDPFLALYDENGNRLDFNDDFGSGSDARLVFTPTVSGTYYIATGEIDPTEGGNEPWQLGIREVGMTEPAHIADWTGSDEAFHFTGTPDGETIYGTSNGDFISGLGGFDTVMAFDGDDWINASGEIDGGAGNDKILGGATNDIFTGGAGNDDISGNGGMDTYIYADGDGKDFIRGFGADDVIQVTTSVYASAQEIIAAADVQADRTVLRFGDGDKIVLFQPDLAALSESNFDFSLGVI